MMLEHTPGPWRATYKPVGRSGYHEITAPRENIPTTICETAIWKDAQPTIQGGNARLIEAVPDMFNALKKAARAIASGDAGDIDAAAVEIGEVLNALSIS